MRADRLITIMLLLQRRGRMSSRELAEQLEVSRRTILRDIEALGAGGVPIYSVRGPHGGFEIWKGFKSQLTGLSDEEAAALFLLGLPQVASVLRLGGPMERARLKLLESLPPGAQAHVAEVTQRFHYEPMLTPPPASMPIIVTAVDRRRVLRATCDGEAIVFHPLAIVVSGSEWYIVADGDERAILAVADLKDVATTGARFERPASFDVRAFWSGRQP